MDFLFVGVTHVMTPIAVTRSLPLVTNMAVVGQSTKHVAHILTNSSLDKVIICLFFQTTFSLNVLIYFV